MFIIINKSSLDSSLLIKNIFREITNFIENLSLIPLDIFTKVQEIGLNQNLVIGMRSI